MPKVKEVNIIRIWAGAMGFTQDGIPNIGFVPGKEGLIIAAGFAAGMSQGAVVGKIVADLITQGNTPFPMEIYDPKRFVGKKNVKWWLSNGAVVYLFIWIISWTFFFNLA